MKTNPKLSDIFKAVRNTLGKTQKELANTLGVSSVYISYVENGSRLPSKKLLSALYRLSGKKDIPKDTLVLWQNEKTASKTSAQRSGSGNSIFKLRAQGLYSVPSLTRLQQKNPKNVIYVVGLYHLYKEQGKKEKADKVLLSAISQMQSPEDRKWLEAYHFQLEGTETGFLRAIAIMEESLALFLKHPILEKEKHSELLFRLALLHYDFGVFLFEQLTTLDAESIQRAYTQFENALSFHQKMRTHCPQDLAQLDYANIYFWLASLSLYQKNTEDDLKKRYQHQVNEISSWKSFIQQSQSAHFSNYYFLLGNTENNTGLFSQEYLIGNISFQALAYARLGCILPPSEWDCDYFEKAESILASHAITFIEDSYTVYRYYYNLAHVYSLKAGFLAQNRNEEIDQQAIENALDLCEKGLKKAYEAEPETLINELKLPEELIYFQKSRPKRLKKIIG